MLGSAGSRVPSTARLLPYMGRRPCEGTLGEAGLDAGRRKRAPGRIGRTPALSCSRSVCTYDHIVCLLSVLSVLFIRTHILQLYV